MRRKYYPRKWWPRKAMGTCWGCAFWGEFTCLGCITGGAGGKNSNFQRKQWPERVAYKQIWRAWHDVDDWDTRVGEANGFDLTWMSMKFTRFSYQGTTYTMRELSDGRRLLRGLRGRK